MYRSIFATNGLRAGRKSSIASAAPVTAALVVLTAFSGCKTLSWKPSGKMFAWGKKPADSVEGAEGLVLPTSPATKYSPQAMASLGTQSGASASSPSVSSPYGSTAMTTGTPKAGLAAQANGYQTGPYQMGSSPATTTPNQNMASTGNTTIGKNATSTPMSNPYGGPNTFASAGGSKPEVALPNSVSQALSQSKNIPSAYPALPNAQSNALPGVGSTPNTQTAAGPTTPPVSLPSYTTPATPSATTGTSMPSYPSMPSASNETKPQPSAYSGVSVGGTSSTAGNTPATGQATAPSSSTTPFAPGTTGRPNRYSFGN